MSSDGADRMARSWSILVSAVALTASGSALAQVALDDAELRAAITGRSATFPDGSIATWHADGVYSYKRRHDGRGAHGRYTITGGRVCLDFFGYYGIALGNGWVTQGCDHIIRHSNQYVLMDSRGRSFPLVLH